MVLLLMAKVRAGLHANSHCSAITPPAAPCGDLFMHFRAFRSAAGGVLGSFWQTSGLFLLKLASFPRFGRQVCPSEQDKAVFAMLLPATPQTGSSPDERMTPVFRGKFAILSKMRQVACQRSWLPLQQVIAKCISSCLPSRV